MFGFRMEIGSGLIIGTSQLFGQISFFVDCIVKCVDYM
jgi:hypothetical protein